MLLAAVLYTLFIASGSMILCMFSLFVLKFVYTEFLFQLCISIVDGLQICGKSRDVKMGFSHNVIYLRYSGQETSVVG